MTPEEGLTIVLNANSDMQFDGVASEYGNYYIYGLVPKSNEGTSNSFLDTLYSVDKNTEEVSYFQPLDHPDYRFPNVRPISI